MEALRRVRLADDVSSCRSALCLREPSHPCSANSMSNVKGIKDVKETDEDERVLERASELGGLLLPRVQEQLNATRVAPPGTSPTSPTRGAIPMQSRATQPACW